MRMGLVGHALGLQGIEMREKVKSELEADRQRLQDLVTAGGHSLVHASLFHMTTAVAALNRRFLTPRKLM